MDFITSAIADRLDRAADRLRNAGSLQQERKYREAAAGIRAGLSLDEAQDIELRLLSEAQRPLVQKLSSWAALGEYDPAPVDPAPVDPAPVDPTPVDPAPVDPTPVDPAPVDPSPVDPAPVAPAPVDPSPVAPAPVDPSPVDPAPVDPTPVDPAPEPDPSVDMGFISTSEGGQLLNGYVPDPTGSNSGVTVGTGVDIGQLSADQLNALDIPQSLRDQLAPYVGLTGEDAVNALAANPLSISAEDAEILDRAVIDPIVSSVQSNYDNSGAAVPFASLPPEAQTILADMAVQYGPNLAQATPNFWRDVTSGDWNAALAELQDFGDSTQGRRDREAALLQQAIDRGAFAPPPPAPPPPPPPPSSGPTVPSSNPVTLP